MESLVRLRMALNMTGKDFAEKLGVSQPTLSKCEAGYMDITLSSIKTICKMFGVSYEFLAGYSDKTGNKKIDSILTMLDEIERIRTELNV